MIKKRAKLAVLTILTILSFDSKANVFGKDDRVMLNKKAYLQKPYSMIVKVDKCSGALVGANMVLTAYHCINKKYKNGKIKRDIKVTVGKHGFSKIASTIVTKVITGGESAADGDWAVLFLKDNLGLKYGYFKVKDHVNENFENLNMVGYSADLSTTKATAHHGCQIKKILSGSFLHNCDSTGGASGSAIWRKNSNGEYEILGVHYGGRRNKENAKKKVIKVPKYTHELANIASRPLNFFNIIYENN